MVIDFHTHVYPDKIAERTVKALSAAADVQAHTDGTLNGLLQSMYSGGIDYSVILPVATRKGQFDTINRMAMEINEQYDRVISLGGIHPDDEEIEQKLRFLKDNGIIGVKIHPDYQETMIDDERYIRIVGLCRDLGMLTVTHAGKDPAYDVIHCPPDRGRRMLDRVMQASPATEPFFIFAHLGGSRMLREVEQYLVGQPCYIDISCSFADIGNFSYTTDEEIVRVIRSHGADRILFATDSPWNPQGLYVERLRTLPLSDRELEMILHQNAEQLLQRVGCQKIRDLQ